jgi:biopolymer transport protein ExbD
MSARYKPKINHNSEFELDLAPLLAVMVKLVPVLLVSSAFVQMMIIETDLPQVVKQAIAQQDTKKSISISLIADKKEGVRVIITENGHEDTVKIALNKDREFDYPQIQNSLREVKRNHPEVFKIEMSPGADVSYREIVKIMDEARRSRESQIRFPVKVEATGEKTTTDFMFPEVVFANTLEG